MMSKQQETIRNDQANVTNIQIKLSDIKYTFVEMKTLSGWVELQIRHR